MKTKTNVLFIIAVLAISFMSFAQSNQDVKRIEKIVTQFADGVDEQKGSMISSAFREGASFYGTNNRDKIISVTPDQLASMHEAKKFGGKKRKLSISNIDISDGIVAIVKAVAQDDTVHYTYYVSLTKIEDKWLIQSVLQHSRKK